jgi:hypothetical protein
MKREPPHNRGTTQPAEFVRPSADDQLNLAPDFSATPQRRGRTKKIFVIKETSRLPSIHSAGKKIQRILIFDNHPESLRLVFGRRLHPDVDLSRPQRVSSWELIIVSIVTIGGLIGMFWPLL